MLCKFKAHELMLYAGSAALSGPVSVQLGKEAAERKAAAQNLPKTDATEHAAQPQQQTARNPDTTPPPSGAEEAAPNMRPDATHPPNGAGSGVSGTATGVRRKSIEKLKAIAKTTAMVKRSPIAKKSPPGGAARSPPRSPPKSALRPSRNGSPRIPAAAEPPPVTQLPPVNRRESSGRRSRSVERSPPAITEPPSEGAPVAPPDQKRCNSSKAAKPSEIPAVPAPLEQGGSAESDTPAAVPAAGGTAGDATDGAAGGVASGVPAAGETANPISGPPADAAAVRQKRSVHAERPPNVEHLQAAVDRTREANASAAQEPVTHTDTAHTHAHTTPPAANAATTKATEVICPYCINTVEMC